MGTGRWAAGTATGVLRRSSDAVPLLLPLAAADLVPRDEVAAMGLATVRAGGGVLAAAAAAAAASRRCDRSFRYVIMLYALQWSLDMTPVTQKYGFKFWVSGY